MKILFIAFVIFAAAHGNAAHLQDMVDREHGLVPEYGSYRVVHQDEVSLLTPDSPYELLLMGPLKPCQGIIITRGGYVFAYHRSSLTSLKFLPALVENWVRTYGLEKEAPPKVFIYAAYLDDERFSKIYGKAYERHHGVIKSQTELMSKVREEIASLLGIALDAITVDINPSKAVLKDHYAAESIAIDKNGHVVMAAIDDHKCNQVIERERAQLCLFAVFGPLDHANNYYPPYVRIEDAPVQDQDGLRLGMARWPSYDAACAYCERITCDRTMLGDRVKLLQCSRCKRTKYCGADCQKADWRCGHNKLCSVTKTF